MLSKNKLNIQITCLISSHSLVTLMKGSAKGTVKIILLKQSNSFICCAELITACKQSLFSLLQFWCISERLHELSKIFVEHALHAASAIGKAGSVLTMVLSIDRCSHSKNQFDERKQD